MCSYKYRKYYFPVSSLWQVSSSFMQCRLFIFFFLCCTGTLPAQVTPEQLFEGSETEKLDKADAWTLTYTANPDSGISLPQLRWLVKEAEESGDELLMLYTRYQLAYYHVVMLNNEHPWLEEMDNVVNLVRKTKYDHLWIDLMQRTGIVYYYVVHEYSKGLQIQLRAYEKYKEIGHNRPLRAAILLCELAHVYYKLGNYEQCAALLKQAANLTGNGFIRLQALNTLGLAYRNQHKADSALLYFYQTLEVAKNQKDSAWIGIASINIAKYYINKGEYDKALPYAEARYKYSKQKDSRLNSGDSCEALIVLAQIDIHNNNLNSAFERLTRAEKSFSPKSRTNHWNNNFGLRKDMYWQFSDLYLRKGNSKEANAFGNLAYQYEDSIFYVKKNSNMQMVHIEAEAEKQMNLLKQAEDQANLSIQRRNFSIIAIALGAILLLILYNRQRIKSRKERELFQNRKQLLYSEKRRAEEQLSGYMGVLQEKNKIIEEFQNEIEKLKLLSNEDETPQIIETLEKLQKTTLLVENDWIEFKELFEKVYVGFFDRLNTRYPDITQAETRLLALTKLNISARDMANILGISPASVRKTGYRFLKKVGPEGTMELADIAASI